MCEHHSNIVVNATAYDPTRTTVLRNRFVRELNKRFDALTRDIRKAVDTEDVFALRGPVVFETPGDRAFEFITDPRKIEEFLQWIQEQIDAGLLSTQQFGEHWTSTYILDSYKRGVFRARQEMVRAGYNVPPLTLDEVDYVMGGPIHIERVAILFTRVFNELKGITDVMSQLLSRVLTQGFIDGDNPREIARKLVSVINGSGVGDLGIRDALGRFIPAKRRAEILARTEVIRAHHLASINEYRSWGVDGVHVMAEFATAGDARVCPQCAAIEAEGKIYTLDEIEPMIPVHPQCRCIALPRVVNAKIPK